MICIRCNRNLPDDAKFCRFCAAEQNLKSKPSANQTQKPKSLPSCINCHATLIPNAKFCKVCGTPAAKSNPKPEVKPESVVMPAAPSVKAQSLEQQPVKQVTAPPVRPKVASLTSEKAKSNAISVLIIVLVILLVGAFGYWGWKNKRAAENEPNSDTLQKSSDTVTKDQKPGS